MAVRLSVRVRILATLLVVTGLGMVVAGSTAYLVQRDRVLSSVDERLAALASDASGAAAEASGGDLDDVLSAIVQRVRPGSNESTLGIVDGQAALSPGGTVDFRLDGEGGLIRRAVTEASAGEVVRGTDATPDGRSLRYVAVPVTVAGDSRQGLFLAVVDLRAQLAPLTDAFLTYAVIAAAALLVVAVVGWFVAGRLLRPIRSLTAAATRISATDVSERIPVRGEDDISQLTATVNGMLDRLDGALTAQRRLLDDVGHELKTPLTIVRGHLELMDPADRADVVATRDLAVDELDRMNGLVADITTLADTGRSTALTITEVDVSELTRGIQVKASALADRDWELEAVADGRARLDADRVTQAMLQLATNAAHHGATGAGDRIRLGSRWEESGRTLRFWVHDDGVGIPIEAQDRIFERFQRGTPGGSRGPAGSGLGLAIVARIAQAHGGEVSVESRPGEGTTFSLRLPASSSSSPPAKSSVPRVQSPSERGRA